MGCKTSKAAAPAGEQKRDQKEPDAALPIDQAPDGAKEGAEKAPDDAVAEPAAEPEAAEPAAAEPALVKVEIVSAKGLRNADFDGKNEPYCVVELTGKPESKAQTGTAADPKEPLWKHAVEVSGYSPGDSLTFTVKDSDLVIDDILGRATLSADKVKAGFEGDLPLSDAGEGKAASLFVKVEGTDPTLLDKVNAVVEEVKEAVAEKVEEAKEMVSDAREAGKEQNKAVVDDESKSVCCRC